MEIETKIFDVKKIRKVLKKHDIEPYRICDIVDYFFDLTDCDFGLLAIDHATKKKSGGLSVGNVSVEIPDPDALSALEIFFSEHSADLRIRIRVIDSIPFVTFKGPKISHKGIKSREEIEARVGDLSHMMLIFLSLGARLTKSVTRIREIYHLPKFPHSEVVIDRYEFAHETLEYAEIEAPNKSKLLLIADTFFGITLEQFSDTGITSLHKKKEKRTISRRLEKLAEYILN